MSDPAMWSRAKQVATYIVREWMLLDADNKRIMSTLVEEIELELDRSFEAGMRAAHHATPLIRAQVLEEAAKVAEGYYPELHDADVYDAQQTIAATIRAAALEEAAKVAEDEARYTGVSGAALVAEHIAATIRGLKEQP